MVQVCVNEQVLPQDPQFAGSEGVLTHLPLQMV
jgi:hypothetical protein